MVRGLIVLLLLTSSASAVEPYRPLAPWEKRAADKVPPGSSDKAFERFVSRVMGLVKAGRNGEAIRLLDRNIRKVSLYEKRKFTGVKDIRPEQFMRLEELRCHVQHREYGARHANGNYGLAIEAYETLGMNAPRVKARLLTQQVFTALENSQEPNAEVTAQARAAVQLLEQAMSASPLERGQALIALGAALRDTSTAVGLQELEAGWKLLDSALPPNDERRFRPLLWLTRTSFGARQWGPVLTYGAPLRRMILAEKTLDVDEATLLVFLELRMGVAAAESGKKREARKLLDSGVGRARDTKGHKNTANLAAALDFASHGHLRNRDVKAAAAASGEAMKILDTPDGRYLPLPTRVDIIAGMGRVLRAQKKKGEALRLFRRAAMQASLTTRGGHRIIDTHCLVFMTLTEQGRREEAAAMRERVVGAAERFYPEGHYALEMCRAGKFDGY